MFALHHTMRRAGRPARAIDDATARCVDDRRMGAAAERSGAPASAAPHRNARVPARPSATSRLPRVAARLAGRAAMSADLEPDHGMPRGRADDPPRRTEAARHYDAFVSAVTSECGKARDAVAAALRQLDLRVAVQSDLRHGAADTSLLRTLHDTIRDCDDGQGDGWRVRHGPHHGVRRESACGWCGAPGKPRRARDTTATKRDLRIRPWVVQP